MPDNKNQNQNKPDNKGKQQQDNKNKGTQQQTGAKNDAGAKKR
jgi:hypothetical protein